MRGLVWKDTIHSCDLDVIDGREDGLWWDHTDRENTSGQRIEPILFGVIHHQAGEGKAKQTFAVLNKRENPKKHGDFNYLSVHFEIDQEGVITQMADLDTVCHQAGHVNQVSWGVEIANLGLGDPPHAYPRKQYTDMLHGVTHRDFLTFLPAQVESTYRLCLFVNVLLGIPFTIPLDVSGVKARRGILSKAELDVHRGLVGHYMITEKKIDPSPHLLDELIKRYALITAAAKSKAGPARGGTV
jgi:hypothetical protein